MLETRGLMRKPAAFFLGVLLAAAAAAGAGARDEQRNATAWVGTVGFVNASPITAGRRANARLVVSPAAIDASFEGFTGASHDSPSARTSCSIHYRFVKREGAWSYYHQVGVAHYTAVQYVQNAPCESIDYGAVKTISVGAKLRADFGSFDRYELFEPAPLWRAYLRRA